MRIVSVGRMRELDAAAIAAGTPGFELMERAGVGAGRLIAEFAAALPPPHRRRLVFLAGKGNNGGDAYVAARHLAETGDIPVALLSVCHRQELVGDAAAHAALLPDSVQLKRLDNLPPHELREGDIIVDGLLGTGAKGAPKPPYDAWIAAVNAAGLPVVALDIPSGLNGDDGSVAGAALTADLTITMGFPKSGLVLGEGLARCGRLRVVDIGIPPAAPAGLDEGFPELVAAADIRPFLGRLPADCHKKSRGVVLVIGGCAEYRGAPFLAAAGAARCGAGFVSVAVPGHILDGGVPAWERSLVVRGVAGHRGGFSGRSMAEIASLAAAADAVVVGPGMSTRRAAAALVEMLGELDKPVVYDADALNLIAAGACRWRPPRAAVLTPHPGEEARLRAGLGMPEAPAGCPRTSRARELADRTGAVVVLKGHRTVTAAPGGFLAVNGSGSPALATAGTGDVLAGMVAAMACGGGDLGMAAAAAVFIHGLAGELQPRGNRGMIAEDLIEHIPAAARSLSPFA